MITDLTVKFAIGSEPTTAVLETLRALFTTKVVNKIIEDEMIKTTTSILIEQIAGAFPLLAQVIDVLKRSDLAVDNAADHSAAIMPLIQATKLTSNPLLQGAKTKQPQAA